MSSSRAEQAPDVIGQAGQHLPSGRDGQADLTEERDFFVSYTQVDLAWAEWIAWELEADGYSVRIQAWDMPPGADFVHEMHQAVRTSQRIILVLSSAYMASQMAEAEWRTGFASDPAGEDRRLLPVRIEDFWPEGLLTGRIWIDMVGLNEADARAKLRHDVQAALGVRAKPVNPPHFPRASTRTATDRPAFPASLSTPVPAIWNVPFEQDPLYTSRDEILAALWAARIGGDAADRVQVLQGPPGVGKTALVTEFAWRWRAAWEQVWWTRAEDPATLVSDYTALAVELRLPQADRADQRQQALRVRDWLENHDRWLLIFDNAQAPEALSGLGDPLPRLVNLLPRVVRGQVIVTSRDASWRRYRPLTEVDVFSPEEAIKFLLARSGKDDEQAAGEVASQLGLLPLALEQAGAYVEETQVALAAYLELVRVSPGVTLGHGRPRHRPASDTVVRTWRVSLERLRPTPGAAALLEVCAFLAPEAVPRGLFAQQLDPPAEALASLATDPFALNGAVAALRRFGLAKVNEETLTVHRLLQLVVRDDLETAAAAERADVAVRLVAAAFPNDASDNPNAWLASADLLPHVRAAAVYAERHQVELARTSYLLDCAAGYVHGRLRFDEARALAEKALALAEAAHGANHMATGDRLNNLALVHYDLGDLDKARTLHERALAIRETQHEADQLAVTQSLNNLAEVLRAQGHVDQARALHERALVLRETQPNPELPRTATAFDNLASVAHHDGDLERARTLREPASSHGQTQHYPDHVNLATTRNNLGLLVHGQGDSEYADTLLKRALAIREDQLGRDHPHTATTLLHLGAVRHSGGDLGGAQKLLERALVIRETQLGPDHPGTATALDNLGALLFEGGDLDRAGALLQRARAVRKTRLGSGHLRTAESRFNLAMVLHARGCPHRARILHESALAIREQRLGADHPRTAQSLNQLALILLTGDPGRARDLLERALAIREQRLGREHPDTAATLDNLALAMETQGDLADATRILERAMAIRERRLGADHPDTVRVRARLATMRAAGLARPMPESAEQAVRHCPMDRLWYELGWRRWDGRLPSAGWIATNPALQHALEHQATDIAGEPEFGELRRQVLDLARRLRVGVAPSPLVVDQDGRLVDGVRLLAALHLAQLPAAPVVGWEYLRLEPPPEAHQVLGPTLLEPDRLASAAAAFRAASPYRHVYLPWALGGDIAAMIHRDLAALPWALATRSFYQQHEVDLRACDDRHVGDGLRRLRAVVLGPLPRLVEAVTGTAALRVRAITGHMLTRDQWIGVHNDAGEAGLMGRLTFHFGADWTEDDGGLFGTHDDPGGPPRHSYLPRLGSAILFDIDDRSHHSVSPVVGDRPRYSVVVSLAWAGKGSTL